MILDLFKGKTCCLEEMMVLLQIDKTISKINFTFLIKRLKERNEKLLNILEGKYKDDLKMSIENNYLEKFFYECRL